MELGGPGDDSGSDGERKDLPFEIVETDTLYAIFVRMNRLSRIDPALQTTEPFGGFWNLSLTRH